MTSAGSFGGGFDAMSRYEQRAWTSALDRLNEAKESDLRRIASRVTKPISRAGASAWTKVPLHGDIERQVSKAAEGLMSLTLGPAMRSANLKRVEERVGKPFAEFGTLDLGELDRASPRTRILYTIAAAGEGAASAVAVTGAEVATTVSAGTTAGVALGAVAVDAVSSIAVMGRIVAIVASEYGYDTRLPEEEVFALGAISLGSATTPGMKLNALASLSRLTQTMMRQATWRELNEHGLVQLVRKVFDALALRLTHQRLAQVVPFVGVVLNGGMSARMADQTYQRARDLYRLRFLSDKYGIDPATWVESQLDADALAEDVLGSAMSEVLPTVAGDHGVRDPSGELEGD